jgi:hypothetical protein
MPQMNQNTQHAGKKLESASKIPIKLPNNIGSKTYGIVFLSLALSQSVADITIIKIMTTIK